MSLCYNWSQLLPELETLLFWCRFLLIWKWCLCFVHIFGFPLSLLLCNSCIKYPGTPLLELNKQKHVKIQEDMLGEVFVSEMSGVFYLLCPKIQVGDLCLTVLPFQVHNGQYCSRFHFSSGSWTLGHVETAVIKGLMLLYAITPKLKVSGSPTEVLLWHQIVQKTIYLVKKRFIFSYWLQHHVY